MDNGPLVKEEIDARRELVRRLDNYRPLKAAFWLKASDNPFRYLYFAADRTDAYPDDLSYREVLRVVDEMQDPDIDPYRIKVIAVEHPLVRDAVRTVERFPAELGKRLGGNRFGDLFADDLYIYPSPLPAAVS